LRFYQRLGFRPTHTGMRLPLSQAQPHSDPTP
jgi:hypothetical protein